MGPVRALESCNSQFAPSPGQDFWDVCTANTCSEWGWQETGAEAGVGLPCKPQHFLHWCMVSSRWEHTLRDALQVCTPSAQKQHPPDPPVAGTSWCCA